MIADFPFLANLAVGIDRVMPQGGDAQVVIPSVVSPVIIPLYAHDVSNASTDLATTSKFIEQTQTKLNVAAATDNVIILPKGLYDLQIIFAARANFTTAVLNEFIAVQLLYQGFTMSLGALMLNTEAGLLVIERTVLLTSQATLNVLTPATNAIATNSIAWHIAGSVIRRI